MIITAKTLAELEACAKTEGMITTTWLTPTNHNGEIVVRSEGDFSRLLDFCPTAIGSNPKSFPFLLGLNGGDGDGDLYIHGISLSLFTLSTADLGAFFCGPRGSSQRIFSDAFAMNRLPRMYVPIRGFAAEMGAILHSSSPWTINLSASIHYSRMSWI